MATVEERLDQVERDIRELRTEMREGFVGNARRFDSVEETLREIVGLLPGPRRDAD